MLGGSPVAQLWGSPDISGSFSNRNILARRDAVQGLLFFFFFLFFSLFPAYLLLLSVSLPFTSHFPAPSPGSPLLTHFSACFS